MRIEEYVVLCAGAGYLAAMLCTKSRVGNNEYNLPSDFTRLSNNGNVKPLYIVAKLV